MTLSHPRAHPLHLCWSGPIIAHLDQGSASALTPRLLGQGWDMRQGSGCWFRGSHQLFSLKPPEGACKHLSQVPSLLYLESFISLGIKTYLSQWPIRPCTTCLVPYLSSQPPSQCLAHSAPVTWASLLLRPSPASGLLLVLFPLPGTLLCCGQHVLSLPHTSLPVWALSVTPLTVQRPHTFPCLTLLSLSFLLVCLLYFIPLKSAPCELRSLDCSLY